MIHSSKDERKFLWVQYKLIESLECSRRGYMNAPEEYIVLLHIECNLNSLGMQFKVLKVLYSYKSQKFRRI